MAHILENNTIEHSVYSEGTFQGPGYNINLMVQEIINEIGFEFIQKTRAMPKLRSYLV